MKKFRCVYATFISVMTILSSNIVYGDVIPEPDITEKIAETSMFLPMVGVSLILATIVVVYIRKSKK